MVREGILVKEILMGDCDDPYLYAAFPIHEWEKTEECAYIKKNLDEGDELVFFVDNDTSHWGFIVRIYAPLKGEALTFYRLKYMGVNQHVRMG